jgi:hypothetical protein
MAGVPTLRRPSATRISFSAIAIFSTWHFPEREGRSFRNSVGMWC